jgi:hypothetical protein
VSLMWTTTTSLPGEEEDAGWTNILTICEILSFSFLVNQNKLMFEKCESRSHTQVHFGNFNRHHHQTTGRPISPSWRWESQQMAKALYVGNHYMPKLLTRHQNNDSTNKWVSSKAKRPSYLMNFNSQ